MAAYFEHKDAQQYQFIQKSAENVSMFCIQYKIPMVKDHIFLFFTGLINHLVRKHQLLAPDKSCSESEAKRFKSMVTKKKERTRGEWLAHQACIG